MLDGMDSGNVEVHVKASCRMYLEDCQVLMRRMPSGLVNCIVTSPPYWAMRAYAEQGADGLGREKNVQDYINNLCDILGESGRVLRDDGLLWLNIGDTRNGTRSSEYDKKNAGGRYYSDDIAEASEYTTEIPAEWGVKPRSMVGVPWRVAFELVRRGWLLRSAMPWVKTVVPPAGASVSRPTGTLEYLFLFAKKHGHYWDDHGQREQAVAQEWGRLRRDQDWWIDSLRGFLVVGEEPFGLRVAPASGQSVHTARFAEELVRPCILLGCPVAVCSACRAPWRRVVTMERQEQGSRPITHGHSPTCKCAAKPAAAVVFDPFSGSGTTQAAALKAGRSAIYVDRAQSYYDEAKATLDAILAEGPTTGLQQCAPVKKVRKKRTSESVAEQPAPASDLPQEIPCAPWAPTTEEEAPEIRINRLLLALLGSP